MKNWKTRRAEAAQNKTLRQIKEEKDLGSLEAQGSAIMSDKAQKGSIGGMIGGLGTSMLAKYLASAALTAATGGAAGPAMMAMLTAASHAAPAIGSTLGSALGSSIGTGSVQGGIDTTGMSAKMRGAGHDTMQTIRDTQNAQMWSNAMKAGASTALLGGTGEWINKAKDAGIADISKIIGQGGQVKDIANVQDLLKYKDAIGTSASYGAKDLAKAGWNKMSGLLGGVKGPVAAATGATTAAPAPVSLGWEELYKKGTEGVTGAMPQDLDAYQEFVKNSGIDMHFDEWLNEYENSKYI